VVGTSVAVGSTRGRGLGVAKGVNVGGGNGFNGRDGLIKIAVYRPHNPNVATTSRPLRAFQNPPLLGFLCPGLPGESLITAEF
jgi:hypothetical protein